MSGNPGSIKLPTLVLPKPPETPAIDLKVPRAHVPSYQPLYIPPNDLRPPAGIKKKGEEKTEQPPPPKLTIPRINIELPLPTTEVVMTATYAAVAAVATTTLATPFFNQIKKKVQTFLQKKIDKWKENRKKKKKDSLKNSKTE